MKNIFTELKITSVIFIAVTCLLIYTPAVLADTPVASIEALPSSAKVGEKIVISGKNFAGTIASLYWDTRNIARDLPISADGSINYSMEVPDGPKGTHTIKVIDNSNWAGGTAENTFETIPSIRVFPDVMNASGTFTVYGTGFAVKEGNIKIKVDGSPIITGNMVTDMYGNWSTLISFPTINPGRHTLTVESNSTSASELGEQSFLISPWMEVSPLEGPVGTQIFMYAWGMRQNEDGMTVTLDNKIIKTNIRAEVDGTLKLDGSKREFGSFLSGFDYRESVYIPKTTQGEHIIGLYGSSFTPKGTFPDYTFNVIPNLTVDPQSGKERALVNIEGTGFTAGETVVVKYDDKEINNNITTDSTGSFSLQYSVPQSTGTNHTFSANGNKGNSSKASFTLIKDAADAIPELASPPDNVQIAVFKTVGDVYVGAFRYVGGLFGYLGGGSDNKGGLPVTTLQWSIPEDTGAWNYHIQISKNSKFSSLILDKTVNSPNYQLYQNEADTNGIYYWRVKGIDNLENETEWSDISKFEIVSMSSMVAIISIAILVLVIVAIVVIIIAVRVAIMRNRY